MADEKQEKAAGQHVKIMVPEGHKHRDDDSSDEEEVIVTKDDRSSEVPTTSQSTRVDISRIQSAYSERCHSRSNFPDVLSEYGDDEDTRHREKENKKKKKKSARRDHDDDELKEKRRKRREERYMTVMDDISSKPEGSQYYSKKVSGIAIAVHKYEQQSKPSPESPRTPRTPRSTAEEAESRKEMPRFKARREKHVLTTNTDHLKNISKTDTAKIIELQDRLIREGKLRTQADIDKFREDVKSPLVLSAYLRANKKKEGGSQSTLQAGETSNVELPAGIPGRSLSHISEKSSRPITRQDWAITQHFQHKHEPSLRQNLTPAQLAKQAASDLEKRFPKAQMPPLKCFTIDLGEKPPDPEEIRREIELKVRVKQRKKFLRKLHRMHQLSMAHNAATNRILEKHDDITNLLEGNSLRDVVSVLPAPEDAYISQDEISVPEPGEQFAHYYDNLPMSRSSLRSKQSSRESLLSRDKESLASRASSKESRLSRRNTFAGKHAPVPEKIPPIPLTMDEIRTNAKIVEAKCLSTFWTNYVKTPVKKTEIF